jgi:hypothetical protein
MIDISAYYKMHPKAQRLIGNSNDADKLSDEDMSKDQPPEGDFLLLLPSNIFGFHMQEKRWGMLSRHFSAVISAILTII